MDQSFVPEAYDLIEQGKIKTLTDLNRFFAAWLEVAYHQKVHNSFKQRPMDRYEKDDHIQRFLPPHELVDVFLLEETRKPDKTGCLSLLGRVYEVESILSGHSVQVRYDPYDLSEIQVWKDGQAYKNARILKLRDPKRESPKEDTQTQPSAMPPTGLNYVELLYEEQQRQLKGTKNTVLQDMLNGGDTR